MLYYLFSWPVVGAAIAILLGFGRTFMTTATNFSRICFTVAAFLLLAKFGTWAATIQTPLWQRILATIFIFGLIGVGWVASWRFLNNVQHTKSYDPFSELDLGFLIATVTNRVAGDPEPESGNPGYELIQKVILHKDIHNKTPRFVISAEVTDLDKLMRDEFRNTPEYFDLMRVVTDWESTKFPDLAGNEFEKVYRQGNNKEELDIRHEFLIELHEPGEQPIGVQPNQCLVLYQRKK